MKNPLLGIAPMLLIVSLAIAQTKQQKAPPAAPPAVSRYMQRIGLLYLDTDEELNTAEYQEGEDRDEARISSLNKTLDGLERTTRIEIEQGSPDAMFLDDLMAYRTKRHAWAAASRSHVDIRQSLKDAVHSCKAEADEAIDSGKLNIDLHELCQELHPAS